MANEEPTAAAFVTITTTRSGPTLTASVPGSESARMMETVNLTTSIAGAALGPYVMAKAIDMLGPGMPWQSKAACIVVAAILPLIAYCLARRSA